jgi:hypothetical protein
MAEYIIRWNAGYGDEYDIVEAETEEEARDLAYQAWLQDAESNVDYGVEGIATDELKEEFELY